MTASSPYRQERRSRTKIARASTSTFGNTIVSYPATLSYLPPLEAYQALREQAFVEALQAAGYDAIAFGGSGATAVTMEWHIFDPELAISPETGQPLAVYREPAEELSLYA